MPRLCSYRDMIPRTKIHFGREALSEPRGPHGRGFLVQGIEDDELPEGLLCDVCLGCFGILRFRQEIKSHMVQ